MKKHHLGLGSAGRTAILYGVVGKGIFEKVIFEQRFKESKWVSLADVRTGGGESGPDTTVCTS